MEKRIITSHENQILDEEVIKSIIEGYFECKIFFESYNNFKDINQLIRKKQFLSDLSNRFYNRFKNHPAIVSDKYGEEVLKRSSRVFIKIKDGSFPFPTAFTRFFDRLKDINTIPIQKIDLSSLDYYMEEFSDSKNLTDFLLGFFIVIKSLIIPLRERDIEMIQILTDIDFLKADAQGKNRIHPPDLKELVKVLGYTDKQFLRIKRAYYFLYNFRICYTNVFIMNPTKFGFFTGYIEYPNENRRNIEQFTLWNSNLKNRRIAIVNVPYRNVNEILNEYNFVQMTKWYWNCNFEGFSQSKNDSRNRWINFKIPNFLSKNVVYSDFVAWDLTRSFKDDFSEEEIEILKNLTKASIISHRSMDGLSKTLSSGGIRHILDNFIENGVYQLYPYIHHVGLKEGILLKIWCEDKEFFQSIIHNLLTFPIVHVFTNDQEKFLVAYFQAPSYYFEAITDNLHLLSIKLKDKITMEYELMPKEKRISLIPQLDFKFNVKDGMASLEEEELKFLEKN